MEDPRLGCGLSTEKAESESAISIGRVRPRPHYITDTPHEKHTCPDENQKYHLQREKLDEE